MSSTFPAGINNIGNLISGPMASGSYGRQAVRWAGRQADEIQVGFKMFKILYKLNYVFGLLFCLLSLQCYYGIRTAFQSTFLK